ncbi:MAG: hypothetical protein MJZ68_03000 [archaeon]|nr:hypothetical protein [archaeon]
MASDDVTSLEREIEEYRLRIEGIEKTLESGPGKDQDVLLRRTLERMRDEMAELERRLDEGRSDEEMLEEYDRQMAEIRADMADETDPVVRNNLEVALRFLQMERNHLLVEMTVSDRKVPTPEERIAELERETESRSRIIGDLTSRIKSLEKELDETKAIRDPSSDYDGAKVSVTSARLSELNAKNKNLGYENTQLKIQISDLKKEMDTMRSNIRSLTEHCKESDRQVLVLQDRLRKSDEALEKARSEIERLVMKQ